ncbi:hypothetical protein J7E99_08910 [Streptomyces sp. ISL-44]|uniref:hypothetical protein n=1 Tax=unclassified Streptomyces TaxID=2593676 RepID=UPI001BEB7E6A|nr:MULTISPECIES: hypothetical protein [unclassified Streptomyces]MBT2540819.1 hypothetical protein [Streptomyces sp. ISL-44]UUU38342.1 hypothetical protein JIW86_05460 [Streptomyces sp. NBC_00162]
MTIRHRFHLDQNGHSISVLYEGPRRPVEVLVDGKTVAVGRAPRAARTVLTAELPGDPPQPFAIDLAYPDSADDSPMCALMESGTRYLMPDVPLRPGR